MPKMCINVPPTREITHITKVGIINFFHREHASMDGGL